MTRTEWCAVLAKLVSPSFPTEATKALIDMLPAFSHMPDALFRPATLEHVACWKRRQSVPAFDEIKAALIDWQRTFVPDRLVALPAPVEPDRAQPNPEELAYVAERVREAKEVAADHARRREISDRALPSLPNVSLRGEALQRVRDARPGIVRPRQQASDREMEDVFP